MKQLISIRLLNTQTVPIFCNSLINLVLNVEKKSLSGWKPNFVNKAALKAEYYSKSALKGLSKKPKLLLTGAKFLLALILTVISSSFFSGFKC